MIEFVHVPTVDELARQGRVQGAVLNNDGFATIAEAMKINAARFKAATPEERQAVERAAMARNRTTEKGTK